MKKISRLFALRLSDGLRKRLLEYKEGKDVTLSTIIRIAIEEFLEQKGY